MRRTFEVWFYIGAMLALYGRPPHRCRRVPVAAPARHSPRRQACHLLGGRVSCSLIGRRHTPVLYWPKAGVPAIRMTDRAWSERMTQIPTQTDSQTRVQTRTEARAAVADGQGSFAIERPFFSTSPAPAKSCWKVRASGVCHTDWDSLRWGRPLILGHEGAGASSLAVGQGVTSLPARRPRPAQLGDPLRPLLPVHSAAKRTSAKTAAQSPTRASTAQANPSADVPVSPDAHQRLGRPQHRRRRTRAASTPPSRSAPWPPTLWCPRPPSFRSPRRRPLRDRRHPRLRRHDRLRLRRQRRPRHRPAAPSSCSAAAAWACPPSSARSTSRASPRHRHRR